MAERKPEKNYREIKVAVGSLFRAATLSTDPGQTLQFSAGLINSTRAFLIQKLEERVPDSLAIPAAMNAILKTTATKWVDNAITDEGIADMDARIGAIFKNESMARYGLTIYRDTLYCDELHNRWQEANALYIKSPAAWAYSNSALAAVNKQLTEIIVRHDLMSFPMADPFNLDREGANMGAILKRASGFQVEGEPVL